MELNGSSSRPSWVEAATETVARTLRHEVGDLLQTVYSTVAILQERLPADWELERRLLGDLRGRAETCKNELDAVHDLVCPLQLATDRVDLGEVAGALASQFARRFSHLSVKAEGVGPVAVQADGKRVLQVGSLLVLGACQNAESRVTLRTGRAPGTREAEWSVEDDGPGPTPEQMAWLERPFATTHQAMHGLGLALGRRVAELHGGRIAVGTCSKGGFRVTLVFPTPEQV